MLAGVISRDEIRGTYDTIRPWIRRTPVMRVDLGDLDPAPAASVGIAALLAGAYKPAPGEHVAVVISGANMSAAQLD